MKVRFGQPIHQNSSDNLRPQHQHQVPLPKVPTETVPPIPEIKFPEKSDSKDSGECNKKIECNGDCMSSTILPKVLLSRGIWSVKIRKNLLILHNFICFI
jgi:hypothetical protein